MFQSLSAPLQNSLRFLRLSLTCTSIRFPYGSPSSRGRSTGLLCSPYVTSNGLGPAYSPVTQYSRSMNGKHTSRSLPFWAELISIFSSSLLTTFIGNLHLLTIPSSLAPGRIDASSLVIPSRFRLSFDGIPFSQ